MIVKKNINKVYLLFLASHLILWTIIPSIVNTNLPLDTIEALAWGSNLEWGFSKHPPLSAFAAEFFFKIFGNQDWAYYLLSQIFIIITFVMIFKLSKDFFKSDHLALISILLLEGIFFFNYTSPEFNVNVSQLPFWALSIFFAWRCIKYDKIVDFICLGLFMGIGFLAKYLFLYLIVAIKLLFIYLLINKKVKTYNFLLAGPVALIVTLPHLVWLIDNNFITVSYGLQRTGDGSEMINHIIFPTIFIFKQISILLPFFIMSFFLIKNLKFKKIIYDEKMIFLIFTCFLPIALMVLTSLVMAANIRTMWMTPFYVLSGVVFIKILKNNLNLNRLRKFYLVFLFFFFLSPVTYTIVSLSNDFKRTDYPGKEISRLVQNRWDDNFSNEIKLVIGDEWYAGNLSYHLQSRPIWTNELKDKALKLKDDQGVIYTGNPKILKNICPGVFGTIKPVGYCMIGKQ